MVCASDQKAFWTPHRRCVSVLMGGNPEHAGEIMSLGWFGERPCIPTGARIVGWGEECLGIFRESAATMTQAQINRTWMELATFYLTLKRQHFHYLTFCTSDN